MSEQHTRGAVTAIPVEGDTGSWLASLLATTAATAIADTDDGDPTGRACPAGRRSTPSP